MTTQENEDLFLALKALKDLRAENEQLKKHNAIAAKVVPALMELNRELLAVLRDNEQILTAIECGHPKPVSTGMILDNARAAIRKATQ